MFTMAHAKRLRQVDRPFAQRICAQFAPLTNVNGGGTSVANAFPGLGYGYSLFNSRLYGGSFGSNGFNNGFGKVYPSGFNPYRVYGSPFRGFNAPVAGFAVPSPFYRQF